MHTTKMNLRLTVLASALLMAYHPAHAEDDDLASLSQPASRISVGLGAWSHERRQLGIYDDMANRDAVLNADLSLVRRDNTSGTWMTLDGRNLGLDTRQLRGEFLRQGDLGIYLEYSRIPRENPLTFTSSLQGSGTSTPIVASGAAQQPLRLGTQRDRIELGASKALSEQLGFVSSYQEETKEGTRQYGLGSQPFFMVEPVNSKTRQLKLALEFANTHLQWTGGYMGSWYTTENPLISATNSSVAGIGTNSNPNLVPLSQPLNNQAHQVFFDGGYSVTPTTRATFKFSYAHATQDEALPSYGLAAPNTPFIGAPSHLGGEVNTTIAQLGISARPTPKLSILASLRYQDIDDKTPLAGFVGNDATGAISVHNTPHSITTTSGKVEANYVLPARVNLTGGIDINRQDRSYPLFEAERYVPFRTKVDEDTYRIQLRRPLADSVSGSIAYAHSKRNGSSFLATEHYPSDLINPIHIADRTRDKWKLAVNWMPSDALSLQGSFEDSRDEYGTSGNRPYGLTDGDGQRYSIDASYVLAEDWNLNAWFSHDTTQANQLGASFDRVTGDYEFDRAYHLKDQGDSFGIGLRGKPKERLQLGADLQWALNRSDYRTAVYSGPGAALAVANGDAVEAFPPSIPVADLPRITNKVLRISAFAQYALDKSADVRVDLIHERWRTDDWSYTFANGSPFTYGGADGTIVTSIPRQTSNFIGARYIYKFR